MPDIKFTTSADLKGLDSLKQAMDDLEKRAERIADVMKKWNAGGSGSRSSEPNQARATGTTGMNASTYTPPTTTSQRAMDKFSQDALAPHQTTIDPRRLMKIGTGESVPNAPKMSHVTSGMNLSTAAGIEEWMEGPYSQAAPMIAMMNAQNKVDTSTSSRRNSSRSGHGVSNPVPIIGGTAYTPHATASTTVSTNEIEQWFQTVGKQPMSPEQRTAYSSAVTAMASSKSIEPMHDFYAQHGASLGAPQGQTTIIPTSRLSRAITHFKTNATSGKGIGHYVMSGLKGAAGGMAIDAATGGAIDGVLAGGVIGDVLGGIPGAIIGAGLTWAGGQVMSSPKTYQENASQVSALAHSLNRASQGVEQFRVNLSMAGADVGLSLQQSAAMATSLTSAFGKLSSGGLSGLVKQTGAAALHFGLSAQQMSQVATSAAVSGVTSGVGANMTPAQYTMMLDNAVKQSGMQGRQGSFFTGLQEIYNTSAGINPTISNANGLAAQYTALNKTGIQGLQGQRGAQLMANMQSAFANPSGIQQALEMQSILSASGGKITNPFQMMSIMEQGTAAKVGQTTLGAAYQHLIESISPTDKYLQAALMSGAGLNENQALAVIKSNALNAASLSEKAKMVTPLTTSDKSKIVKAVQSVEKSRIGYGITYGTTQSQAALMNVPNVLGSNGDNYYSLYNFTPQQLNQQQWNNESPYERGRFGLMNPVGLQGATIGNSTLPTVGTSPNFLQDIQNTWNGLSGKTYKVPANQNAFVKQMTPYAQQVSKQTGIPAQYILGQWGYESAGGTSEAAIANFNFGGVAPFGSYGAGSDSAYAGFSSLSQFAKADAQVLNQPRYAAARAAAQNGASPQTYFAMLTKEGYDTTAPQTYAAGATSWVQAIGAEFQKALDSMYNKIEVLYKLTPSGNLANGPVR